MFAISYLFAYSFNIITRMHNCIVPVRAPPYSVRVLYSGRDDTIEQATFIVCINVRVPKIYDLWALNAQGVFEIYLFARV